MTGNYTTTTETGCIPGVTIRGLTRLLKMVSNPTDQVNMFYEEGKIVLRVYDETESAWVDVWTVLNT